MITAVFWHFFRDNTSMNIMNMLDNLCNNFFTIQLSHALIFYANSGLNSQIHVIMEFSQFDRCDHTYTDYVYNVTSCMVSNPSTTKCFTITLTSCWCSTAIKG